MPEAGAVAAAQKIWWGSCIIPRLTMLLCSHWASQMSLTIGFDWRTGRCVVSYVVLGSRQISDIGRGAAPGATATPAHSDAIGEPSRNGCELPDQGEAQCTSNPCTRQACQHPSAGGSLENIIPDIACLIKRRGSVALARSKLAPLSVHGSGTLAATDQTG